MAEDSSITSALENILLNSPNMSKSSTNSELLDMGFIPLSSETVYNVLPDRLRIFQTTEGN